MTDVRGGLANARDPIRYAPAIPEFFKNTRREVLMFLRVMENSNSWEWIQERFLALTTSLYVRPSRRLRRDICHCTRALTFECGPFSIAHSSLALFSGRQNDGTPLAALEPESLLDELQKCLVVVDYRQSPARKPPGTYNGIIICR